MAKVAIDLTGEDSPEFWHSAKENIPPYSTYYAATGLGKDTSKPETGMDNPLYGRERIRLFEPPPSVKEDGGAPIQQTYWQPPWPAAQDSYCRTRYRLPPYGCHPSHPDAIEVAPMHL